MRSHEEIERILASYRDASPEERARADEHLAGCAQCAARLAAYQQAEVALAGLAQPALPGRLKQPLPTLLRDCQSAAAAQAARRFVLTPALASAAAIMLLLIAASVLMWTHDSSRAPVTLTPTLTMTLTPTSISARETEPPALVRSTVDLAFKPNDPAIAEPTPAPAPVPAAGDSPVLLAGFIPRATMSH